MARTKQTARKSNGGKASRKSHAKKVQNVSNLENYTIAQLKGMLKELDIKDSDIKGSGKDGRILKQDRIDVINLAHQQKFVEKPKEKESSKKKSRKDQSNKKPKKQHYDKLTFIFEYEKNKPISFKHKIERGDYELFYGIVNDFLTNEQTITEKEAETIIKLYPELKGKIDVNDDIDIVLNDLFDRSMIVTGVESLGKNKYKINWAT